MMIKSDLVRKIKDYFDLNIYETKVWLALLSKGVVSAGETAEISGVPRSRTYDVLESLAKHGFAIVKLGKPVKYIAVDPKTVIEKMKMHVMADAQERVKSLSTLRDTDEYLELEQLHKSGVAPVKVEDLSGFVRGRSNVLPRLRELIEGAEKEVLIHTSATDFENKSRVLNSAIEEAKKRNVKVKVALSGNPDVVRKMSAKSGIKSKHTEHPGRFYVIDKKQMLLMSTPESADEEVGIILNAPHFIGPFTELYESQVDSKN